MRKQRIRFRPLIFGALLSVAGLAGALIWSGDLHVGAEVVKSATAAGEERGDPNYPKVGVRTGVFNDGQAALWDLNLTDHFHYFGPEYRARGYRPEQPIPFSHVIHVQKLKMECQYCHWNVAKSSYAAIPEVDNCLGCHNVVPVRPEAEPHIKALKDAKKANKPIEWVKVHVFPDYAKFPHQRHVKAGVACQECHGQVAEMDVVERVSSMKMGWCIECHRQRGTTIDCVSCHY